VNPYFILGRFGDSAFVPPSTTGSSGKRRPEYPTVDLGELSRKAMQAENNARAALILGIVEADDL
jgi:hypothetical protein